jgi:hypothetical protein
MVRMEKDFTMMMMMTDKKRKKIKIKNYGDRENIFLARKRKV